MIYAFLLAALAMGFFGSPHCLGMCGGIVTAFGLSMQNLSPAKRQWFILCYHIGRLGSYLILGLIAAWIGKQLFSDIFVSKPFTRYLLSGMLIFVGLMMLGLPILNSLERLGLGLWHKMAPVRAKVLPIDSTAKALGAGLLWGFLPCGMVYGALAMAIGIGASDALPLSATVGFITLFWAGTLPMLLMTGTVLSAMQRFISKNKIRALSGILMIVFGLANLAMPMMMHGKHGGMNHGGMDHSNMDHSKMNHDNMDHSKHQH